MVICKKTFNVLPRKIPYVCERSPESLEADADDVIDLGAPRLPRRLPPRVEPAPAPRRAYVPNPRLYPGQARSRRTEGRSSSTRPRRRKRVLRRPVPNSRLYRPAPQRPPPPPARPRASWPPPAPARPLDTASRVALRLGERRQAGPACCAPAAPAPPGRLVVTLPPAAGGDSPAPVRYRPASEHFRARAASGASTPAGRAMDAAAGRREMSPDRASDGNDSPSSAPSEYLAEFLSAIMRRQYAEALKYCRLILQFEPQNATARGFHPLLLQKLRSHRRAASADGRGASSGSCSPAQEEESSLELDSESGREELSDSGSCSGLSAARWESSRSDADDNGNLPHLTLAIGDLENDNVPSDAAAAAGVGQSHAPAHSQGEDVTDASTASTSLQRLRAQFACSIK